MKIVFFSFLLLVCSVAFATEQTKALTSNMLTQPLKEFIKKYDKERKVEKFPIVYVEVDKDQRSFEVRFMDKRTFFAVVGTEDSTLFMDGGIIEGRKVVLCYEAGRNFMTNTPLSCAQIMRDWDKDLYEAFLKKDALRDTDVYDLKHEGMIMLSHAPMMFITCDKTGKITNIRHQGNRDFSPFFLKEFKRLGIPLDSVEIK